MKFQKLFTTIVVFLLATGAGSAFAQDACEGGIIQHDTLDSFTLVGQSCRLQNVTINGDVTVVNAEKFTMQNCHVNGKISVRSSADIDLNDTDADSVEVTGNERVEVSLVIASGSLSVTGNGVAYVIANAAKTFDCGGNVRIVATKNQGPNANQQCDSLGL